MPLVTKYTYYVDKDGNYYVDTNGNNFIAGSYIVNESPFREEWLKYTPYIVNSQFKKHNIYIKDSNGSFKKVKAYIFTHIETAIAGIAIATISRCGEMPLEERLPIVGEAIVNISKTNIINR